MATSSSTRASASPSPAELAGLVCRFCQAPLRVTFVDLGMSPLCQRHIHPNELNAMEPFFPLHAYVCEDCFLVQLGEYVAPQEIFGFYHYFSSYSDSWLAHAKRYTEQMIERLGLDGRSRVAEIASNDGYLLQYFAERGIPCLGIEPAANVAEAARARGIDTVSRFFGRETAQALRAERGPVDLLLGNNVLAHVPDLNDFVAGMADYLAPTGTITMEFPHLLRLMADNQFDTIYHEHFSYFSFTVVEKVFAAHGLKLVDVEELPTHGGSLRIYARHAGPDAPEASPAVHALRKHEADLGVSTLEFYTPFAERVERTKRRLLSFLIEAREQGKTVAGYGAPGKGNTLLNYCGIRTDLLAYTVDRSPMKQGTFLPGTRIPVFAPEKIDETRPDYLLILPWNLVDEITGQMGRIRKWGARFVVPIPEVRVLD
jgi:SAM-dependent methyltransferase